MHCRLIMASVVVAALVVCGPADAAAGAASDIPQPWAETGGAQSPAAPKPRDVAKPAKAAQRTDGAALPRSGEASSGAVPPRRSVRTREQVRREARASQHNRRSADGWEHLGGEAGTRSRP